MYTYIDNSAHIVLKKEALTIVEKNRFSKPVAFNRTNVSDQQILKHVARRNFSGYVKKLILADIKLKGIEYQDSPKKETAAEKIVRMKAELKGGTNKIN